MTPLEKQHMLTLANAALAHLEMDSYDGGWRVGSCNRPFGNSFPQSQRDILFYAGAITHRYVGSDEELSTPDLDYAERLWKNLGPFIRDKCKLDPA